MRLFRRLGALLTVLILLGGGGFFYLTYDQWSFEALDEELVRVEMPESEQVAEVVDIPTYVPAVVDLAGDPLVISIGAQDGSPSKAKKLERPPELVTENIAPVITFLDDTMISSSKRFMTTLPSSQEDFMFFQSQRNLPRSSAADTTPVSLPQVTVPSVGDGLAINDDSAGWGETLSGDEQEALEFEKTRVENTTSVAFMKREDERFKPSEEIFVKVLNDRSLFGLLIENGFDRDQSDKATKLAEELFKLKELKSGYVVAMRAIRRSASERVLGIGQLSIYSEDSYFGTLVLSDDGALVSGADPWVRDDLFNYTGIEETAQANRKYRLLDAIYSTAVRNSVPTAIVGEAIMLLSRGNNLNEFANDDDRLVLIYAEKGRSEDSETSKLLYAGVAGSKRTIDCFVYKTKSDGNYTCVSEESEEEEISVVNGMVTPVNGVKTSGFGPRKHPVLKTVRLHAGVDWAAPTGTPIYAAFNGKISYAGDGGGYGNVVRIAHSGGRETRYAHMSRFAKRTKAGVEVKAGEVIGFVGTTGLSTGPHLHFELRQGKTPVDPLATMVSAVAGVSTGGKAIDKFVNAIIRIESGGNPRAKNPLSTASGLGQFINSTWMRMIRTYRPDLLGTMSRQQILDLRFEPTIARAMLYHLTRETGSFLRARGHTVTPGRLYLGHFLGPGDANKILRTSGSLPLNAVLSAGVMNANPFLRGWTVQKIQNWAERKMAQKGKKLKYVAAAPTITKKKVRRLSKEFVAYRKAIQELIKSRAAVL